MNVISLTLFGMAAYAVGEYLSKRYAMQPTWALYWSCILAYIFTTIAWLPLILRTNTLAVTSTIWNIGYFIVSIALGVLMFGEKMSPTQIVGLVLAAVAVVLLSIE